MAWDPDDFRCSSADNFWRSRSYGEKLHLRSSRTSHCRCIKSRLDDHDISRASGSADVLGYEVSPANAYCNGSGQADSTNSFSRPVRSSSRRKCQQSGDGARRWSRVLLWYSKIVVLSRFLIRKLHICAGVLLGFRGAMFNRAQGTESICGIVMSSSAVFGVFDGFMSASVRMHRKRASRSRFVKDVASWLRRLVVSRDGQGSRAVSRSIRCQRLVPCAPSRRMLFFEDVQVRMKMRVSVARRDSVARTSQRCRRDF